MPSMIAQQTRTAMQDPIGSKPACRPPCAPAHRADPPTVGRANRSPKTGPLRSGPRSEPSALIPATNGARCVSEELQVSPPRPGSPSGQGPDWHVLDRPTHQGSQRLLAAKMPSGPTLQQLLAPVRIPSAATPGGGRVRERNHHRHCADPAKG